MKRLIAFAVLASGIAGFGMAPPHAASGQAGVFQPNSRPYGQTYSDWSARWWQWALALPLDGHPFSDTPDFDVSEGQSGQVWFLGAPFGQVQRSCTIPTGTSLFCGIVNSELSSLEGFPDEDSQRTNAVDFGRHIRGVSCTVDGVSVSGIDRFHVTSPQFEFSAPSPWIFGDTGGTGTSVADGYYVFLQPLSTGHHVVHFGGAFHFSVDEGDDFDLDVAVDMTYDLTVAP